MPVYLPTPEQQQRRVVKLHEGYLRYRRQVRILLLIVGGCLLAVAAIVTKAGGLW